MTERLYYTDSYATAFDALITAVQPVNGAAALVLDRTCFYPTSGGQPHDVGTLDGLRVIDVVAAEDGAVLHVVDQPLLETAVGRAVHGELDWSRRYDHMQQHSGQHLLSQTLYQLFGYETVSVHFGATESTIDLETPAVTIDQLAEAERFANTLVFSNLPIRAYVVTDADLARLPLRRAPKVTGRIRIVEIQRFDYSACGGTHVHATGEIGSLKIVKQERRKDQTRLTFLCGWRAWRDYAEKHRLLKESADLFSNDLGQVPALIARTLEQNKLLQRQADELSTRLLLVDADELRAVARRVGRGAVIVHLSTDKDANALRLMASHLQAQPGLLILLASTAGGKVAVVFAASDDLALHSGALLRRALQAFGGSGGGRPELAQGGGIAVQDAQALLDLALAEAQDQLTA